MDIRTARKKNRRSDQVYYYQQLVGSVRPPQGLQPRVLLNLGALPIPPAQWPELAKRIEAIYLGNRAFTRGPPPLEALAQHYATLLRQREFSRAALLASESQEGDGRPGLPEHRRMPHLGR